MKRPLAWLLLGLLLLACSRGPAVNPDWRRIEEEAQGCELSWFMFGNSDLVNRYVDEYVAPEVYARYGIVIHRLHVSDMTAVIQDLAREKRSGRERLGRADLLWINGAGYQQAREAGVLFGSWSRNLPNARHVAWNEASVANDSGLPADGYEAPWGQSTFLLVYDGSRIADPPRSLAALEVWLREHPGRFTYPQPPDPEGSAFVRQAFYELTGGAERWQGTFDEAGYRSKSSLVWAYLQRIEPYLWRQGQSYPASARELERLYVAGEVDFGLSYSPGLTWRKLATGLLPRTTSVYRLEKGTLASTHYLAIPFNAPHKAAAMVVANFLQSPAAQAEKARPDGWGDLPVLAGQLPRPADPRPLPATAGWTSLEAALSWAPRLPEPSPQLAARIEKDWIDQVLER